MKSFKVAAILALAAFGAGLAQADSGDLRASGNGELRVPGIWIDPDGCEHWVMDDGWEGYMSPVIMPDGRPVCGRNAPIGTTCGLLASDQFFQTNSATLSRESISMLTDFFGQDRKQVYIIDGHTDSEASDAYNLELSRRRAEAVAAVAVKAGANVRQVRAFGERNPRATNRTAAGRSMNRRVEIQCVR